MLLLLSVKWDGVAGDNMFIHVTDFPGLTVLTSSVTTFYYFVFGLLYICCFCVTYMPVLFGALNGWVAVTAVGLLKASANDFLILSYVISCCSLFYVHFTCLFIC